MVHSLPKWSEQRYVCCNSIVQMDLALALSGIAQIGKDPRTGTETMTLRSVIEQVRSTLVDNSLAHRDPGGRECAGACRQRQVYSRSPPSFIFQSSRCWLVPMILVHRLIPESDTAPARPSKQDKKRARKRANDEALGPWNHTVIVVPYPVADIFKDSVIT